MTTIHLTPEQEQKLRRYKGCDYNTAQVFPYGLIRDLAAQLPDPYVPKPGDRIHARDNKSGYDNTDDLGEQIIEVTPEAVYTQDGLKFGCVRYLRSEHTFRKVEEEQ